MTRRRTSPADTPREGGLRAQLRRLPYFTRVVRAFAAEARDPASFLRLLRVRLALSRVGRIACPRPVRYRIALRGFGGPVWVRSHTTDVSVLEELLLGGSHDALAAELGDETRQIVDLGANTGLVARWLLARAPNARIVCLEPEPGNLVALRRNLAVVGDRATVVAACIGANSRTVAMVSDTGEHGFRMVDVADAPPDAVRSPVLTMDDVIADNAIERIDVLKCDIEGAEAEVFADCAGWIDRVRTMVVECHAPFDTAALGALLARAGADFATVALQRTPDFGCEILTLRRRRERPGVVARVPPARPGAD